MKANLFLLLAILGLVGTWYFNIQFFLTSDNPSLMNYIAETRTTFPSKSFNVDLLVVLLTFFVWYIPEARRLNMKHWWVFIILSYGIALAFAFPLFLFFREKKNAIASNFRKPELTNMKEELKLVKDFHEKFKAGIHLSPNLIDRDRSALRYKLMKDEVEEYIEGVENSDLENIAKELADILYATFGTIVEHGLQDVIQDVFKEVHLSNMSKDYSEFKMIKGPNYFEANVKDILNK